MEIITVDQHHEIFDHSIWPFPVGLFSESQCVRPDHAGERGLGLIIRGNVKAIGPACTVCGCIAAHVLTEFNGLEK